MPRPFIPYPDRRLAQVAQPVDTVDEEVRAIWKEMLAAMQSMPSGVGLAAPQLGIGMRLAVVDCSDDRDAPVLMANPEVIEASEETTARREASPNLPGVSAEVVRPSEVAVAYLGEKGVRERQVFTGLWATSVQHQIDHLNGMLYVDRLRPVKRKMVLAKYLKQQKKAGQR